MSVGIGALGALFVLSDQMTVGALVAFLIGRNETFQARENVNLATKEVAVILLPGGTDDSTIARSYTLDLRSGRIDDPATFVAWAAQLLHAHLESRARPH